MKNTIYFYLKIFLRRIHWFLLIFAIVTAASVTVARLLPPVYVSATRLLVEGAQIPTNLAQSTVQTAPQQELQIIEQRLMTRVNLLDIARSERVFKDIGTMSPDEIIRRMRQATTIRSSAGQQQATLMNIVFESDSATVAANVVNRYVTIILQDNAASRTDRAGKTLEFFEVEVERLGKELEKQSAEILRFNNENARALPSTLPYRLNQQTTLQSRLGVTEAEIARLQDQRRRLVAFYEQTGTVSQAATPNMTAEQRKLVQLEAQLATSLAIYSKDNPRIKMLQAQLAQQEQIVKSEAALTQDNISQQATGLDIQLADIDARLDILTEQRDLTNQQLAELADSIDRTPAVQIELNALNRDFNNTQQQYNQAVSGLAQAATGERIELLAKGARIAVIDPATVPNKPDRPNRTMIAVGGAALGAFLGLAFIAALEFLNNAIRRPADITRNLGITPLATVPYIRTPMEMVMRRAAFMSLFMVLVIGVPLLLYAVHTYYQPLDLLFERAAEKLASLI